MIKLIGVSKVYPNGFEALHNVSLHIGKEEFVFIVGTSGSGKTTLMKLLYREEFPTSGQVFVDKINVAELEALSGSVFKKKYGHCFSGL